MGKRTEFKASSVPSVQKPRCLAAWVVHFFTATGAVLGILALDAICRQKFLSAFWLMGGAIFIDAVDGALARVTNTEAAAPQIDGALLDNVIDYANYVIVPAFLMIESRLLPAEWRFVAAGLVVVASAYQFSHVDAKTGDYFFRGFPSYWNIVVLYFFLWDTSPRTNLVVVLFLAVLVFVPVKYVYPTRLDYLTRSKWLRWAMLAATLSWAGSMGTLLWMYPQTHWLPAGFSLAYVILYMLVSVYRTFFPLNGFE